MEGEGGILLEERSFVHVVPEFAAVKFGRHFVQVLPLQEVEQIPQPLVECVRPFLRAPRFALEFGPPETVPVLVFVQLPLFGLCETGRKDMLVVVRLQVCVVEEGRGRPTFDAQRHLGQVGPKNKTQSCNKHGDERLCVAIYRHVRRRGGPLAAWHPAEARMRLHIVQPQATEHSTHLGAGTPIMLYIP